MGKNLFLCTNYSFYKTQIGLFKYGQNCIVLRKIAAIFVPLFSC